MIGSPRDAPAPTEALFLDNLLVTPLGNVIAVECKLWRNSEARRNVISQIIAQGHLSDHRLTPRTFSASIMRNWRVANLRYLTSYCDV
jgi:hypothetical protein